MSAQLSLLDLFFQASLFVQLIMLSLMLSSIGVWNIIFQRGWVLWQAKKSAEAFEFTFWSGIDLGKLYNKLITNESNLFGLDAIFVAGFKEYVRMRKQNVQEPAVVLEGLQRAMWVSLVQQEEHLERKLSFLGTVQSMSPYIGLLGTVWGIMQSFRGLASSQQASLAMVAPGIAEALIATAMGLVAAIPAGIAYNKFLHHANFLTGRYQRFSEELMAIMYRRIYANVQQNNMENMLVSD